MTVAGQLEIYDGSDGTFSKCVNRAVGTVEGTSGDSVVVGYTGGGHPMVRPSDVYHR